MTERQVVMITGGASGIGAATAAQLVAQGARVIIADIDADRAAATAAQLGSSARARTLDITSEASWTAALDEIWATEGRLDVLVNNAAIVHPGWARDLSVRQHMQTMQTNCMGAMTGMMLALPRMTAQGFGHFVTVASMVAFLPYPGLSSYAAAKHALRAFHVALALEERDSPLDFTLVYPGSTETPMLDKESHFDALALAFAGTPSLPEVVAEEIVTAIQTRPAEVYLPPERGAQVRSLGTDIAALDRYVTDSVAVGMQKLQDRRRRTSIAP
ncbi:SDR family oxidoreductase [Chachezhania sediminis]|uniref:SDR family oxidoreductase n=1 Tax=Chachezhania sediminis TaxID=2599291 RepID=UPI00131BF61E|nr:SDR family oxidoreductase [Chachezhania sediminis]